MPPDEQATQVTAATWPLRDWLAAARTLDDPFEISEALTLLASTLPDDAFAEDEQLLYYYDNARKLTA